LRDELAVKDSQLVKYAEYHQLLENKVNEEKEIKERLISEINNKGSVIGGGSSTGKYHKESAEFEYETEFLKQKLE
jgi:hypothetical protein